MIFDRELLHSLSNEGWLRSQRHPEADLWIYNYTEKTQYESHWTPETLACRGLILDADGVVVARPFGKFFNLGDPQVGDLPDEPFTVTEKMDGSLGIVYEVDGVQHVASRGSFISEQAVYGTMLLREQELASTPGVTSLFEILYPENRIVVDYFGRRELVMLAAIRHEDGRDALLPAYSGPVVERYFDGEAIALHDLAERGRANAEGFVVAFESGLRVKVKFAEYVRLHRIVTGVNARRIWESMRDGDDLDLLLEGLPDEIHRWIEDTRAALYADFRAAVDSASRVFERRPRTAERKALAAYFLASDANPAVLFRMLDGKPFEDLIWRTIRPEPITPSTGFDLEAAA